MAVGIAVSAPAHAVIIDIDGGDYTNIGNGIGCSDSSDLCLRFFEDTGNPAPFNLNAVGDSHTFQFGRIELDEGNQINANQTNNLSLTATLLFDDPFDGTVQSVAAIGVVTGPVNDNAIDLTISFDPVQAAFGSGGLLGIEFWDLSFNENEKLAHKVTITLLALPGTQTQVPEPGTLALLASGLFGLGMLRRRKAA